MKASEFISNLQEFVAEYGDAEIRVETLEVVRGDDGSITDIYNAYKYPHIGYYVPAPWNNLKRLYCIDGITPSFER